MTNNPKGRPKKEHGKKTRYIRFRISMDDYLDVYQAAEELGVSMSEFIRDAVMHEADALLYGDQNGLFRL